mmetsp:Transcript_21817/g.36771  ORF Transcript_21817/g.36771 Transcript_21817/m.36771 type:complete len:95 (-) Transcript_21817:228-512(-)
MQRATTLAASTRKGEKKAAEGLRPVHRLDQTTSKRNSNSPTKQPFKREGASNKMSKGSERKTRVVKAKKPHKVRPPPERWSKRLADAAKGKHNK